MKRQNQLKAYQTLAGLNKRGLSETGVDAQFIPGTGTANTEPFRTLKLSVVLPGNGTRK